jgi:undecaprenyl-diphosphatase
VASERVTGYEAVVLGIVQGLTEFLPISSTAHLRIVPAFAGWDDPGAAFTAVIQLGTMAAVLVYFRTDILRIFLAWLKGLRDRRERATLDSRMGWYIILGTIPIGIFGFVFRDQIETGARNLELIGSTLIAFALVMELADRMGRRERGIETLDRTDGIAIGMAQALALVPGVSRSGATISAGLFRELDRPAAARYSFLLSIPAVVLSGLFEARKIGEPGGAAVGPTAIATALAFVVGYASIAFLLRYLTKHGLGIFVAYRIVLGVVVLALAGTGVIS